MAEKINVEIGLEGGTEVERQLENIGKAGQEAFGQIQSAVDQVNLDNVSSGFDELGNAGQAAFAKVQQAAQSAAAFEQIVQGVRKVEGAFEGLGNAVSKIGARMTRSLGVLGVAARALGPLGIALGVVGGAFVKFGDDSADALNQLTGAAAKLGQTPQQLDRLQKALTQAGVAPDAITSGLQKLKESLDQDFFPQDLTAGLQNFIAELERMPDGVQRTQLAMQRLDDALGAQVVAGLQTGTISAKNFATALGQVTPATQAQIVEAAKYQQALNQLNAAWTELKAAFAPITTPILNFLVSEIQALKNGLQGAKAAYESFMQLLQADFDLPWLLKLVNFDMNLLLSKWQPVFQAIQSLLSMAGVRFDWLDELVRKSQAASQALQQVGQAGQQAGQQAAQGLELVRNPLTGIGQAAAQAGQQAGQGFQVWNEELGKAVAAAQAAAQGSTTAFQSITSAIQGTSAAVADFVSQLGSITWDAISSAGVAAWNAVTSAIQNTISKLLEFIGLKERSGGGGDSAPGKARGGLIGGRGTGTSDSNLAWLSRGEHVMPAHVVRQPGVLSFLEALRRGRGIPGYADGGPAFIRGHQFIGGGGLSDDIANWIVQIAEANNRTMRALLDLTASIEQSLMRIGETLSQSLFSVTKDMNTTVSKLRNRGLAHGGLLGGRGTGTSDSNLAWLSRGEYITPARAVRQPGVLAFLEALRRSGGNLSAVLDGMGRFALGGLVPRPTFAGGGAVGSMSNVTINFPGTPPISGLRASADVVDQLQKAAALAQVRSGGRKPSRYS